MAKQTAEEVKEFPVSLNEFLDELPVAMAEIKGGFSHMCKVGNVTGHKMRDEWQDLLEQYKSKPI